MSAETPTNPYSAFEKMTDEEVVLKAKEDNVLAQEYLLHKYRKFVRAKARSYFLIGAEREDIIQEGMIGLYKAIRDFKGDKLSSFRAFAELCVTRQIITAIKTATRQKHIPLNSYVSLNKPIYEEDSDRTLMDVVSGVKVANPEDMIISREEFVDIENKMNNILSDLEWRVLISYLDGKSYQEIATELNRHIKSIDNALQRVKRKLEKYITSEGSGTDLSSVYSGLLAMDPSERFASRNRKELSRFALSPVADGRDRPHGCAYQPDVADLRSGVSRSRNDGHLRQEDPPFVAYGQGRAAGFLVRGAGIEQRAERRSERTL